MTRGEPGTVLLVGAGKMGGALLRGWLDKGWGPSLTVLDPDPSDKLTELAATHGFHLLRDAAGAQAPDTVVLAIKPQMLEGAAAALRPICGAGTLLISVLAGKTVADLRARLPEIRVVVRAMPNTPAAVGQGVAGVYAAAGFEDRDRAVTEALLGAVGAVEWLEDEGLIDAVTAVSGSGPAYVFFVVEALAAAARAVGLPPDQAERLARATVVGAGALLAAEPDVEPATLRRNVTSPGGTTAAALEVLMPGDALPALLERAVTAARDRARALSG